MNIVLYPKYLIRRVTVKGKHSFFEAGYKCLYPECCKKGLTPWQHYVLKGFSEGRDNGNHPPESVFFKEGYVLEYPDVKKSGLDPWRHYVTQGLTEGRDNGNHPKVSVFIPEFYLVLNPDIRRAGIDPWVHYAKYGIKEKRVKSLAPYFDDQWYLEHYPQVKEDPEVKNGEMTPEAHYFFKGWKLGYDPSLNFDTSHYLEKYKDVRERGICPLTHYLEVGRFQNRQPYDPHDLTEPKTITRLPEPFESGLTSKEAKKVSLKELEDNALLIMLAEHLGDIVANEPIARYLKWKYPERPLYWVVEGRFKDIVRFNPLINGYLEVQSLKECIEITRDLKGDQQIINLFFDGRPDRVDDPRYFWHARNNGIGFANFYANDCLLSSMSQAAGLDRLLLTPHFWEDPQYSALSKQEIWAKAGLLDAINKAGQEHGNSKVILLHTKSNDPKRDWSEEKFSELTEQILKAYPEAIVAELGMTPIVKSSSERFKTLDKVSDLQLIYQIIKHADIFIGIDSSFMHMANVSGIKAVSIMGELYGFSHHCPYSGRFWRGEGIIFVRADEGKESPSVEVSKVMEAVTASLSAE